MQKGLAGHVRLKCGKSFAKVTVTASHSAKKPQLTKGGDDQSWMVQFRVNEIAVNGCCPACKSDNIQRLSILVAAGTAVSTTNFRSIGVVSDLHSTAIVQSQGTAITHSQTNLAIALQAPPHLTAIQLMRGHYTGSTEKILSKIAISLGQKSQENKSLLGFVFIVERLAFQFIAGILSFMEGIIVSFKYRAEYIKYSNEIYPVSLDDWRASAFCHKCGIIFRIG